MEQPTICKNCRYHSGNGFASMISYDLCRHPDAAKFDRVHGFYAPSIRDNPPPITGAGPVIEACNLYGRFEQKQPWWRIWR